MTEPKPGESPRDQVGGGITPQEAFARITALCDAADRERIDGEPGVIVSSEVRPILAEVTPEPGVTLTSEEAALATEALRRYHPDPFAGYPVEAQALADRLEAAG